MIYKVFYQETKSAARAVKTRATLFGYSADSELEGSHSGS